MRVLSGKEPAAEIKKVCRQTVRNMGFQPSLAIIQVEGNPASDIYVRNKMKDAEECGIKAELFLYKQDVTQQELLAHIQHLNTNPNYHGIIVQLPLPKHLNEKVLLDSINVQKDVDGLSVISQGMLFTGRKGFAPCTPEGVIRLFDYYNVPLEGKSALVVGRSNLVGSPLARLLQDRGATVTTYHTKTPELFRQTDMPYYDILCFCTGQGKAYSKYDLDNFNQNHQYYIADVGIAFDEEGKMCGDFDPRDIWDTDPINYTPVPGGIGLMTRAVLMDHVVTAACVQEAISKGMVSQWK